MERKLAEVGINLDRHAFANAAGETLFSDVNEGNLTPLSLVIIESVLFGLPVKGDKALDVACRDAARIAYGTDKVEHVPDVAAPDEVPGCHGRIDRLMIQALELLGVVVDLGLGAVEGRVAVHAIF